MYFFLTSSIINKALQSLFHPIGIAEINEINVNSVVN